ncbi:hypothetical protein [Paenisporosarcina sp. TG20]|uniref:hypothetical protein n=1 Tax=Paenisporosarcina sp. TG20 TaxID=1211706 RepID=UPI00350EE996
MQGQKDGIVPFAAAQYLYDSLGSDEKHLIVSPIGKHHICYSEDFDEWYVEVLKFLQISE